jgi:hypothetical protein
VPLPPKLEEAGQFTASDERYFKHVITAFPDLNFETVLEGAYAVLERDCRISRAAAFNWAMGVKAVFSLGCLVKCWCVHAEERLRYGSL